MLFDFVISIILCQNIQIKMLCQSWRRHFSKRNMGFKRGGSLSKSVRHACRWWLRQMADGKMVVCWYQAVHGRSIENRIFVPLPVAIMIDGKQLLMMTRQNGHIFVATIATGKHLLMTPCQDEHIPVATITNGKQQLMMARQDRHVLVATITNDKQLLMMARQDGHIPVATITDGK